MPRSTRNGQGGGGASDLAAVLAAGNDAADQDILELRRLLISSTGGVNKLVVGNFLTISSLGFFNYDTDDSDFTVGAGSGSISLSAGLMLLGDEGAGSRLRLVAPAVIFTTANVEPDNGELIAGWWTVWLNPDNVAPSINFKAKRNDGTVVTASIPLA